MVGRLRASLVACVIASAAVLPARAGQNEKPNAPPPGTLVDIGGHKLHLHCLGAGAPSLVLEAGAGDSSARWSAVQAALSKRFKACAYDRAGSGWSEQGPVPRTMKQEVFELHALLNKVGIPGPYVLAGHSYGGLLVRLYAEHYGRDVIGIVLVDPTHESTRLAVQRRGEPGGTWVRIRDGAKGRAVPNVQTVKANGAQSPSDNYWAEELQQMYESRARNPQPLGDRPLIVLAAGRLSTRPPDTPVELWNDLQREKREEKADLARLSRNARLVRDPSSGHHIHVENPQLVVRAIEEVIEAALKGTKLVPESVPNRSPR